MIIEKAKLVKSLSNTKIVLGNGADLYCGLKTTYYDFFSSNTNIFSLIEKAYNSFSCSCEYANYKIDNTIFEINCLFGYAPLLRDKITVWDVLFYLNFQNEKPKPFWCDIEKSMRNSFVKISKTSVDQNYSPVHWDNVQRLMAEKDLSGENKYDVFMLAFCIVLCKNMSETGYFNLFSFLKEQLVIFEQRFGNYIKNVTTGIRGLKKKRDNMLKSLGTISKISSIDTFNYSLMSFDDDKIIIKHVNGTINNPIFGIDRNLFDLENDILIREAEEFLKTSRRIDKELLDNKVVESGEFNHVVVFGHSLNKQDYSYFYPLLDKIRINDTTQSSRFVVAYHIYDEQRSDEIRRTIKKSVFDLFASYEKEHLNSKDLRLLDFLTTQDRIVLFKI